MRVVTYNLGGLATSGAVAAVLRHLRPDVLCATEVPPRHLLRRLARGAGLEIATRCGGRRTGTAVLIGPDVRVLTTDQLDLPRHGSMPRRWVAQAIVASEGGRTACMAVQLGTRPDEREDHARDVLDMVELVGVPAIVGCDLNEGPWGLAARRFAGTLVDAYGAGVGGDGATFPNPEPHLRRDYIFVDPALTVSGAIVVDEPPAGAASHHRPVAAEITVGRQMTP